MKPIRCYFSFRSPFAALTIYRLRRSAEFADIDIELMPVWPEILFGGHMDNPTDNLFKMAYIFADAARQAQVAGADHSFLKQLSQRFTLPEEADYRTEKRGVSIGEEHWDRTHKAFLYARKMGGEWAFADLVCARRFGFDGQAPTNVMDPDSIRSLAEQCGLDGEGAVAAVGDAELEEQMSDVARRSEADGVFGVPFFVIDKEQKETFWGNDRLEYVLRSIRGESRLPVMEPCSDQLYR